ncbi:MAG: hypothetical protein R3D29_05595 [Nitratireductor sp.]
MRQGDGKGAGDLQRKLPRLCSFGKNGIANGAKANQRIEKVIAILTLSANMKGQIDFGRRFAGNHQTLPAP